MSKGLLGTSLNLTFGALRDQLIAKVDPFKTPCEVDAMEVID